MIYGLISEEGDQNALKRLQKSIAWETAVHHPVSHRDFSGGFFLDPRLPHTVEDFLYIDPESGLLVLLWGEIYNRAELLGTLGIAGYQPPDPTLIARAYSVRGTSFVEDLNGDYALVIYPPHQAPVLVFRDHLGVKPIAFYQKDPDFYFSSDVVALCRVFHEKEINIERLLGNFKFIDERQTYHPEVRKVTPGHGVSYQNGQVIEHSYWQPERIRTDRSLSAEQMLIDLDALLTDAVRIRSSPRFRAGAHVSSGLDSSMVAALARREYPHQAAFYGYSWSPARYDSDALPYDERDLIAETCAMADLIPVYIDMELKDVVAVANNFIAYQGYLPEVKTIELAQNRGTNLIFSGWGGDEFISKGEAGMASDFLFSLDWRSFFKLSPLSRLRKLYRTLTGRIFFPAIGRLSSASRRGLAESCRYLKEAYKTSHPPTLGYVYRYRGRRDLHLGYLLSRQFAERTEVWSVLGYKRGVEYRYPLVDRRIVEYMLKIPSKALLDESHYSRIILRKLSAGLLPEGVRWKESKDDPAFHAHIMSQTKARSKLFLPELETFKNDPHLAFIDFEQVEQDILEVQKDENYEYAELLSDRMWAIKEFHEFFKSYLKEN